MSPKKVAGNHVWGHCSFRLVIDSVSLLEDIDSNNGDVSITGDFNIHMDNQQCSDTKHFIQILDDFGLISHGCGHTHIGGHTLDLVITRKGTDLVKRVHADDIISDHLMVCFTMSLRKNKKDNKTAKKSRSLKDFNIDEFNLDLKGSEICTSPADDLDDLVTQFDETLSLLLDKHAPEVTTTNVRTKNGIHRIFISKDKKDAN